VAREAGAVRDGHQGYLDSHGKVGSQKRGMSQASGCQGAQVSSAQDKNTQGARAETEGQAGRWAEISSQAPWAPQLSASLPGMTAQHWSSVQIPDYRLNKGQVPEPQHPFRTEIFICPEHPLPRGSRDQVE
jgi:hypothetical protein